MNFYVNHALELSPLALIAGCVIFYQACKIPPKHAVLALWLALACSLCMCLGSLPWLLQWVIPMQIPRPFVPHPHYTIRLEIQP